MKESLEDQIKNLKKKVRFLQEMLENHQHCYRDGFHTSPAPSTSSGFIQGETDWDRTWLAELRKEREKNEEKQET